MTALALPHADRLARSLAVSAAPRHRRCWLRRVRRLATIVGLMLTEALAATGIVAGIVALGLAAG